MALIYNGVLCNTIEELEQQIVSLSEDQKQKIRNDFLGLPNESINSINPVTARQMKKALALANKLETIETFISTLPEPQKTLVNIEWKESNEFQRDNPILNQMASLMGMTTSEIDSLFNLARTL